MLPFWLVLQEVLYPSNIETKLGTSHILNNRPQIVCREWNTDGASSVTLETGMLTRDCRRGVVRLFDDQQR